MTAPTLTEFLLARIADVEREARSKPLSDLYIDSVDGPVEMVDLGPGWALVTNPARVLAECEAKRRIVYEVTTTSPQLCSVAEHRTPTAPLAAAILGHLAAVYADHPDYDEAWRP